MTGGPANLGNTILGKGKGRANATTADMVNNKQDNNQHSRAQPDLSVIKSDHTPGPEPLPSSSSMKRKGPMEERLAVLKRQRAAARACVVPADSDISARSEGGQENQTRREAAPSLSTQSEVFVTPEPHRMDNPQRGEPSSRALERARAEANNVSHPGRGRGETPQNPGNQQSDNPAPRVAQPHNGTIIDMTDDNLAVILVDQDVKRACVKHCKQMVRVLKDRTDKPGKELAQRSNGVAGFFQECDTLIRIQSLIEDHLNDLITEVTSFVEEDRNAFSKLCSKQKDAGHRSRIEGGPLKIAKARVKAVEQAALYFDNLASDLKDQPRPALRQKIGI